MKELKIFLQATSVAVVGASSRLGALGQRVVANLHRARFSGAVFPVHPRHAAVERIQVRRTVAELPVVPDLAVICTPAALVADQLRQLGEKGVRAVIVMTQDPDGPSPSTPLKTAIADIARAHGMRWMGPGAGGVQSPRSGLNVTPFEDMPPAGKLAIVAQSPALAASALAWAAARGVGLSTVVSLGDGGDVDAAAVLDHLAADGRTQAVLLALDEVADGRRLIASARAVARLKPVVALWADTPVPPPGDAPAVDPNDVCKAAFRRAGILCVEALGEWFAAVETLGHGRRHVGERLGIVSTGGAPARLAVAALGALGDGQVTVRDVGVGADAAVFGSALRGLVDDGTATALLAIVAPTRPEAGDGVADTVAQVARDSGRTVLACWLGGRADARQRATLAAAEVPLYDTPEEAARAYRNLLRFRQGQDALKQLPEPCSFVSSTLGRDLRLSDDAEGPEYLQAYGVISAAIMADQGVVEGRAAASVMAAVGAAAVASDAPGPRVPLGIAVGDDPAFGRAIEAAVGSRRWTLLPALTTELTLEPAQDLRREIERLGLAAPPVEAIAQALFRIADLLVGFPEILGLRIPSFVATGSELQPCDARIWLREVDRSRPHLAVQPYPRETEQKLVLRDGREALVRPVRADEDVPLLEELLAHVSDEDRYLRFCKTVKGVPPELLAKMARVDHDREMAFLVLGTADDGRTVALGMVDAFIAPDLSEAEYSIMLRSDLKGTGLGKLLMLKIIDYCRRRGVAKLFGLVLKQNKGMRGLSTHLGFATAVDPDDDMVVMTLPLVA
jgi:acyl-CoA synthetase (NDP forming)/GNAT superfamily N-acetyltransferase